MVVVDHFDEGLDFAALGLAGFGHSTCDRGWVSLDSCNECVWVGVRLCAGVLGLDYDDLGKDVSFASKYQGRAPSKQKCVEIPQE